MTTTIITCDSCHTRLKISPQSAGKRFRCPKCAHVLTAASSCDTVLPDSPAAVEPATMPPPAPKPDPSSEGDESKAEPQTVLFVERKPAPAPAEAQAAGSESRYRILRSHAKGGLGEVFRARDEELHREVALKQIQPRYADQPSCRARFVKEAEITGRLEHPGIVPIYGLTRDERGRPFYAMRFIEGESLKDAIQRFHDVEPGKTRDMLEFRQLLSRFQNVCNTIAYAHSRGVLHRDLKPANVMLGAYGETLVVDWGLAKNLQEKHTEPLAEDEGEEPRYSEDSSLTQPGTIMGTPAYMSPEQAEGRLDELGPASDIWSLGATLYCLLTGHAPFQGESGPGMLLRVREGDFPPPRRESPWVPPALEAICLKAMTVAPEERYATATDLAQDVDRWLADEPVTAYPEPLSMRLGRWQRRHRTIVSGLFILVFTTLLGVAVGGWLLSVEQGKTIEAVNDKVAAVNGKFEAEAQKFRAEQEKVLAEQEKRLTEEKLNLEQKRVIEEKAKTIKEQEGKLLAQNRAEKVSQYLFTVLRSPDRTAGGDAHDIPIGKVLDAAVLKVDQDFKDDPLMRAEILAQLARTYHGLGVPRIAVDLYQRAWQLLRQEQGDNDAASLTLLNDFVICLIHVGRAGEGIRLLTPHCQPGATDPAALTSTLTLGLAYQADAQSGKAVELLSRVHQGRAKLLGNEHGDTLQALAHLASANIEAGQVDLGLVQSDEALEKLTKVQGRDHADTLLAAFNRGHALLMKNEPAAALPILEANFTARQRHLGDTHRDTIVTMGQLAEVYLRVKRLDRGMPFLAREYDYWKTALGPSHATTLASLNRLTEGYLLNGEVDRALPLVQAFFTGPGKDADEALAVAFRVRLGLAYEMKLRWAEAIPELETAHAALKKKPEVHRDRLTKVRESLLRGYEVRQQNDKAEHLLGEMVAEEREAAKVNEFELSSKLATIVTYRLKAGKFVEAEEPCRECVALRAKTVPGQWLYFNARSMLGESLMGQKKYAEAEPLLLEAHEGLKKHESKIPVRAKARVSDSLQRLVALYKAIDQPEKAQQWQAQLSGQFAKSLQVFDGSFKAGDLVGFGFQNKSFYTLYQLDFEKGQSYLLEASGDVNMQLRIEDVNQKVLYDDLRRSSVTAVSTTVFSPPLSGKYRVIVANREGKPGLFFLRVQQVTRAPTFQVAGGMDIMGRPVKRFPVALQQDRIYVFLANTQTMLSLLDPAGKRHLVDDVTEIVYAPRHAGNYWLVAGSENNPFTETTRITGTPYLQDVPDTEAMRLAHGYLRAGQFARAITWLEACWTTRKSRLGISDPECLSAGTWLAHAYVSDGRVVEALAPLREVHAATQTLHGPKHPETFLATINLATTAWAAGQYDEAIKLFEQVGPLPGSLSDKGPFFLFPRVLDVSLPEPAQWKLVTDLLMKLEGPANKTLGAEHPTSLTIAGALHLMTMHTSIPKFNNLQSYLRSRYSWRHPYLLNVQDVAIHHFYQAKNTKRLKETLLVSHRINEHLYRYDDLHTLQSSADLTEAYLAEKNYPQAEKQSQDCLSICEEMWPGHWLHSWAKSLRGASLAGVKNFAEAESLALAGYKELTDRPGEIPWAKKHIQEAALDNVIFVYESWGQIDRVSEWQRKKQENTKKK